MHALAERLLKTIRKHCSIRAGDRLAVAVSGGADSVALLCLLLELRSELGVVLSVAHVNHRLRNQESDEDAKFVSGLAQCHGLELHLHDAPLASSRKSETSPKVIPGIEAAARDLRYTFFQQLAREGKVSKIATAHTLDDQAETVLLRIFRGTGIRGLSGIHPKIIFEEEGRAYGELVRPLLGFRRAALVEYLREQEQSWREDSSNQDTAFLRNRVRHRLLPMISEEFGDAAIEHMSELAEIARAEEEHWKCGHPEVRPEDRPTHGEAAPLPTLAIEPLLALPLATARRLVRRWLETNAPSVRISFWVIEDVLELARAPSGKTFELSERCILRHARSELLLETRPGGGTRGTRDYEYPLQLPGTVEIPELALRLDAQVVNTVSIPEKDSVQLLDIELVPKQVLIRNWRAGDRFWPSHTAAAKKVKELLSDRHVTGADKKLWPIAVAESHGIIWMRGFPIPQAFRVRAGSTKAIWIREIAGMM